MSMIRKHTKNLLINLIALILIIINIYYFAQNKSGQSKPTESFLVDGVSWHGYQIEKVELSRKYSKKIILPLNKETLIIGLNRQSLEEINELLTNFNFDIIDLDVHLIKNNLFPLYLGKRQFYKVQNTIWLEKYGLSVNDDYLIRIDEEGKIRYLDNCRIDRQKLRLLLGQYIGVLQ